MSSIERVSTGNPEADLILGGGFLANSINIVMGEPGTGKTLFAEQLLFRNADGQRPGLYLTTLSEPLSKVVAYLQQFEFYDENKLGTAVIYDDLGPVLAKDGPEALILRIREAIETSGPKIIVIDSFKAVHDLSSSVPRMRRLVSDLAGLLSAYDTTTFLPWRTESSSSLGRSDPRPTNASSGSASCGGAVISKAFTGFASLRLGWRCIPAW
jgi:circadian clock protein KaiC